MRITQLNVFEKINYYLIFFIAISFLVIFLGLTIDIYNQHFSIKSNQEYEFKTYDYFVIIVLVNFFIVLPNIFTIYVHEMRRQLDPPISKWYNWVKNGFILLVIALVLLPIIFYPYFKSTQSEDFAFLTKYLIEKRHSSIKSGNIDTLIATLVAIFCCIPLIGLFNWFHAMSWKGYVLFKKMIISKTSN